MTTNITNDSLTAVSIVIAAITLIVSAIVYVIQRRAQYDRAFRECTKALHSKNPIEQTTAAILLRSYLKHKWFAPYFNSYSVEAKNLMVALLTQPIPASLQKTIADGFSYVHNMDGQDMQYVNMKGTSIKPDSAVNFEITDKRKYKRKRISMRNVDFFHSVIQESSINFVDAQDAVFYCSLLNNTVFHNCILKEANFRCANVSNVCFDQDCSLEGAKFRDAVGLETVKVKINGKETRPLLDFLDKDGIFHVEGSTETYSNNIEDYRVFVSKLGAMDSNQKLHYKSVLANISEIDKIKIESIERGDYTTTSQLCRCGYTFR